MSIRHHFLALGRGVLPETVSVEGRPYCRERTFKHTTLAAVGLYECDGDRVVCKWYRTAPLLGVPTAWLGKLAARHESRVLELLQDLEGIPRLRRTDEPTLLARQYVPGRPLRIREETDDGFFPALADLVDRIHRRGMACVDLEKAANILMGQDGRPYLFDFGAAFYWPRRLLGETLPVRALRGYLQRSDTYHVLKHFRRSRSDLLTPEQIRISRCKPWPVRLGNVFSVPIKGLCRAVLRR